MKILVVLVILEKNNVPSTYLDQNPSGTFDLACKKPPECIAIAGTKRERRAQDDNLIPQKFKTDT